MKVSKQVKHQVEQEAEEMAQPPEDQWMNSGAPNFETALAIAANLYTGLDEESQEDIAVMVVDRTGGVYIVGRGEKWPTNEDGPVPMGFLVSIEDIEGMLEEDEGDEGSEEEEEVEDETELEEDEVEEGAVENDADTPDVEIE